MLCYHGFMSEKVGFPVNEATIVSGRSIIILYFPIKFRKSLLDEEVTQIIVETAEAIQERYAIEMEAIGCDGNHIHLLCVRSPKLAPGKIVQIFKSITAREVFRRKPSAKKELWGGEFWSDGYYVGTVGKHADWGYG